jgi:hypothetical protein
MYDRPGKIDVFKTTSKKSEATRFDRMTKNPAMEAEFVSAKPRVAKLMCLIDSNLKVNHFSSSANFIQ